MLIVEFVPPRVNGAAVIAAAKEAAEIAAAEVLLAKSRPLVPVDTGAMQASGRVEHGPAGAAVVYERSGADGYNVAARQHEDATLSHPKGGESHFLAKPMQSEQGALLAAMATVIRAAGA